MFSIKFLDENVVVALDLDDEVSDLIAAYPHGWMLNPVNSDLVRPQDMERFSHYFEVNVEEARSAPVLEFLADSTHYISIEVVNE